MAGSSQLVQIETGLRRPPPKPAWLKARAPVGENFHQLKSWRGLGLHTVCESAQCPNIGECWNHRTATFMLLGDICTRRCGFCAVPKGRPQPIDWDEPRRVAEAVATLGLKYAVVTSVNRDDDNLGGARIFAGTIAEIRELTPECRVEVLIPDFQGTEEPPSRARCPARHPEPQHGDGAAAVPRRPIRRALRTHAEAAGERQEISPATVTKTGLMVGLGESNGRNAGGVSRSGGRESGHTHRRPVPAPHPRPSADCALLHARGVRDLKSERWHGLSPRGIRAAGALQLSCARAG